MRAFVIAMACEAEAVRPVLRGDDRLYVSGIGKVNAAAAAQKAICEGADEIWNVGLCGGFGADIAVGDIYGVDRACEYDFDLAQLNGVAVGVLDGFDTPYLPLSPFPRFPAPHVPHPAPSTFPPWFKGYRTLATGDRFNDSEADHDLIVNGLKASLRDMEGAAIAHVCWREKVKCLSLKCVSDVAGKGAMTGQYLKNKARCLTILAQAMKEIA